MGLVKACFRANRSTPWNWYLWWTLVLHGLAHSQDILGRCLTLPQVTKRLGVSAEVAQLTQMSKLRFKILCRWTAQPEPASALSRPPKEAPSAAVSCHRAPICGNVGEKAVHDSCWAPLAMNPIRTVLIHDRVKNEFLYGLLQFDIPLQQTCTVGSSIFFDPLVAMGLVPVQSTWTYTVAWPPVTNCCNPGQRTMCLAGKQYPEFDESSERARLKKLRPLSSTLGWSFVIEAQKLCV